MHTPHYSRLKNRPCRLPPKNDYYILHVVSITTHTHDRRKSIGKNKQKTSKKIKERKEKKRRKRKRKGKKRKDKKQEKVRQEEESRKGKERKKLEAADPFRSALPARMWIPACGSAYVTSRSIDLSRYSDAVASLSPPASITMSICKSCLRGTGLRVPLGGGWTCS